jgi:NADH-quinone oxidoreductase subunit J
MNFLFYFSSAIALLAALLAISRKNAFHALLYLVVSLLAVAAIFMSLAAAFAAVLEIIIYAGAIMVLFIFVVMMLNLGQRSTEEEAELLKPTMWAGPGFLALILFVELTIVLVRGGGAVTGGTGAGPKEVSLSLFGPYLIGVELASFLLLAGLVGAFHLGTRARPTGGNG